MKERIVRYTKEELKRMKGKTDFVQVQNTSDKEIERQVKDDPDSPIPSETELKEFKPVNKDRESE